VSALRAVVFDLWGTLVDASAEELRHLRRRVAKRAGIDEQRFESLWAETYRARETGPILPALLAVDIPEDAVDEILGWRREVIRNALVPAEGALELLEEVRRRGLRTGLITMCTQEVSELWPETALAPLLDETVFSCEVGLAKPDPEIYELACERLEVEPREAVFVGDGANDELRGAERVGMRPVLLDGTSPHGRVWGGERVGSLLDVLPVIDAAVLAGDSSSRATFGREE
jgi:putative hydrolase of the HAD superfamily